MHSVGFKLLLTVGVSTLEKMIINPISIVMRTLFSRIALLLLLLGAGSTAMAQYRGQRPAPRSYHSSRTDKVLRGLDAVETAAEYAMLGNMLYHIDDYTGIRLGFNSASLRSDSRFNDGTVMGFDLGVVFGWYLGRSHALSIEPGIYYTMKGGRLSNFSFSYNDIITGGSHHSSENEDVKMTMHMFETPVVLKGHLPIAPHTVIQPFAGLFMAFGFAGTSKFSGSYGTDKYDTYDDNVLEDFDAGVRLGAGLSAGLVYMEVAYDYGLLNLDADFYNTSLRSKTWSFNVGFNF